MNAIDLVRRLRQHERWAYLRLLEAVKALTPEQQKQEFAIGMGSLWNTVVHLYAADYVWIETLTGNPHATSPFDIRFERLEDLEAAWQIADAKWKQLLDTLTEADLTRLVQRTNSVTRLSFSTPIGDALLHVALHAQYTTAQATNMLRQLGVTPALNTMLITMSREERGPGQ